MAWAYMAASGTGSLVFIDVTADRSSRMNSEVKQAATQGGCSEDLAKHLQGGTSEFGDVHGLQSTDSH